MSICQLSKTQISKMVQSGGFLGSLLSKIAGPLMKVAVLLGKWYITISSVRNNSCYFSNRCRDSIENTWFWNNNFSNFK